MKNTADILLVTATEVETRTVLEMGQQQTQRPWSRQPISGNVYYNLGDVGGAKLFLVQSAMGAIGLGAAAQTVQQGIEALNPIAVIMVGIAFGMEPRSQRIGDVLVARQILLYEPQKVGSDAADQSRIMPRGARADASPWLLKAFQSGIIDWRLEAQTMHEAHPPQVQVGLILSGEKLIDNRILRDQLRQMEPEAIGGEMEGAGLYVAAHQDRVDWILVKAICDWADGNKARNKHQRQQQAARNAAHFVFQVIQQGSITRAAAPHAPVNIHPPILSPPPAFQVPYPQSALFVGRDTELERLAALLDSDETIAVVPAIAGTGGIGKTMLAAEFAHRYRERFGGGVFWLNMEDPNGVESQVAACAGPGGLQLAGYTTWNFEQQIAATRAAWQQPDRRLLIFDNLEDPKLLRWRPSSGGSRVLITTRRATWTAHSGVQAVPLDILTRPDSLHLLLTPRYGATLPDDPAAGAICEALGDLPLAIALASAYLEHYPSMSLTAYAAQISTNLVSDESLNAVLEEGLPTRHAQSIVATFTLSYDRLQSDDPIDELAHTLFHRAAQCAPVAIPRALLAYSDLTEQEATAYQKNIDAALNRLLAAGLLDDLGTAGMRLHRLLAAFARSVTPNPDQEQQWITQVLTALLGEILEVGYPQAGLPYLEHARHIVSIATDDITHADLLNNLGALLRSLGELAAARPYYQRALTIYERVLGPDNPDTATSLNNLGTLLYSLGELAAARAYFQRALTIYERVLGSNHPLTTLSLNNLGGLFDSMGEIAAARLYYQRALEIRKRVLGLDHPQIATSLNNLGHLLHSQGELAAAWPYFQQALVICERVLGPDHPQYRSQPQQPGHAAPKSGRTGCCSAILSARPRHLRARVGS